MNDDEQADQPGLSAADEARIRALLADARHEEPMPDAVVARLDRVLAGLADEPVEQPRTANVVRLAERRRRAARMLVAAAAVVVTGIGVGQLVRSGTMGSADSLSAGDAGNSPERAGAPARDYSNGSDAGGAPPAGALDGTSFQVRPQHFAEDTRRVQLEAGKSVPADSAGLESDAPAIPLPCDRGRWGAGTYVPVEYGRTPAYLVLRRQTGDSQVADLFLCGSDEPARSITLPGP